MRLILHLRNYYLSTLTAVSILFTASNVAPSEVLKAGEVHRNIPYVDKGGTSRMLDIYRPNVSSKQNVPVVIYIHGGGWSSGSKEEVNAQPLIARGLAVVSINYRLVPESQWPAQINDCKAAVRWVRAHGAEYGLDTTKIGVWGISAGGHLAAMLGTTCGVKELEGTEGNLNKSSDVQAVADFSGASDLTTMVHTSVIGGMAVLQLLGADDRALERLASPVAYVRQNDPPFFILHGQYDAIVPVAQSFALASALQKTGNAVTIHMLPGAEHGVGLDTPEFSECLKFFVQYLVAPVKK